MRGVVDFLAKVALLAAFASGAGVNGVGAVAVESSAAVPAKPTVVERKSLSDALPAAQWAQVEQAVDRALAWLAVQQESDGAFPSVATGQPAITSLGVVAFLSRGHQPGSGPYGRKMERAIDFVLKSQQPDGLFSYRAPESVHVNLGASHTSAYNHAIAGLMLCEVYGSVTGDRSQRIKDSVEKALARTRRLQVEPLKRMPQDTGGWRYLHVARNYAGGNNSDSDLSVTGWQLMFLRSAKNAGFKVPDDMITAAMGYVERCFEPASGQFLYGLHPQDHHLTRGMTGAGILSLSLGGKHQTEMARRAGNWLLTHPFNSYGQTYGFGDRFHYSAYYCSQAMAQLGGEYWERFFPTLTRTLLANQSRDGSWGQNSDEDSIFGAAYATALSVLTLTPPYQLLPIYQR